MKSENIDDATGCVHGLVSGCRDCMIDRLTRERDEAVEAHPWFVWESEYAEGCTIIAATSAEAAQEEYRRMSGADPETPLDAKPVTAEDVVRLETQWEQAKEEIGRLRAQVDIAKAELADVLVEADVERTKAETREQKLKDRIVALEAQLTTRGACQCGDDEVCALAGRAQEAERELDRVRVDLVTAQHAIGEGWFAGGADTATAIERKTRALEDGARYAYARAAAAEERAQEAEAKTENIRASLIGLINDHAFRDVPLSWRTTLLGMLDKVGGGVPTPTTPAPEKCDRCGEGDAEVELGSVLRWCKPCFAGAQDEAERTYYPTAPAAPVAAAMTVAMMAAATLTDPAPEQAGEGERCPHACIDEHEQPTDESCPFSKPCPVHDAREVRRG